MPPKSLDFSHVGFFVKDLPKMRDFYVRVLGFQVTDKGIARGRPIVFLSRNPDEHHQIVFAEGRSGSLDELVVNQISLRAGSLQDLRDLYKTIKQEPDVTDINPVDHGVSWSLYFRDPEKNRVEIFVDSPWYVEQPRILPLDLTKSDDEIAAATYKSMEGNPTFRDGKAWKAEFAEQLQAAQGN